MRAILLGTGADHCIPAFRCTCRTCTDARKKGNKYVRQNSSVIIESDDGEYLLIDMPPQILTMLSRNRVDDSRISTILITHRHEDHTLGCRYLFQASTRKNFDVEKPVNLHIPESALSSLSGKLLSGTKEPRLHSRKGYYRINTVSPNVPFFSGRWKITALETGHLSAKSGKKQTDESFAYVIEDSENRVCVYLLDSAIEIPRQTMEYLEKLRINCLIADCTYEKTTASTGHMDIRSLGNLRERLNPDRTIASHISHMNLRFDDLRKQLREYDVEISYDGMTLEV